MTTSQESTSLPAPLSFSGTARAVTIALAIYAVLAPLIVAEILALCLPFPNPSYFGPSIFLVALALALLGPGLAVMTLAFRGHAQIAIDLTARDDSEPQQVLIRLAVIGAALAYLAALAAFDRTIPALVPLLAVAVAGMLSAWLLFVHLMAEPTPVRVRRGAAVVNDVLLISVFLHVGGVYAAPCFPLYWLAILGFGFRFGVQPLLWCTTLSIIGFAVVCATTPFWQAQGPIAIGIGLALVLLPGYAARFIRNLTAAKAQAEQASGAKSRFLTTMSHELQTPLDSIIGTGTLLARTKLDAEQRDLLTTMQYSARSVSGLLGDLLVLSQLDTGKLAAPVETFVLHEVMGGAVAMIRPQAETKGLALTVRVDPRLPHAYRGLPVQLRQILVSLLANAINFTQGGHLALTASLRERHEDRIGLTLMVRDDGMGIPKAAQERLFEIFRQADGTMMPRYGGTGLGCAIAKQLVEMMGGTITLDSEIGKGSTVTVTLTLEQASGDAVRPRDLMGRKAVLISRDKEMASAIESKLRAWRGEVQWIADSETALGELALTGRAGRPAIVIIDGRDNPLASLSLAHRAMSAMATAPLILFIAQPRGGEAIASLAASELAAVIEAPVSEADLASALLGLLAGDELAIAARHTALDGPNTPAHAANSSTPASGAAAAEQSGTTASQALKILVADDNAASCKILKSVLEQAGHEVEIVGDGEAALSALDRTRFDLALLDINMHEISGYEVAKLYRVSHIGEWRLPIVALTSEATSETERLCREAGMDAVLTKPMEAAQLIPELEAIHARSARSERIAVGAPRVVTPITVHPRFVPDSGAVVDEATFDALKNLGGNDFVLEVVDTFRKDATRLVGQLRHAAEKGDLREFRELMHSLRSGAVNVGGVKLCQALTGLRDISSRELSSNGPMQVEKLESELTRLDAALDQLVAAQYRG
jgi:two-component system sensor histidine kinase RpfC